MTSQINTLPTVDVVQSIIWQRKRETNFSKHQRYSKAKLDLSNAVLSGQYPGDSLSYERAMKRFADAFGV